MSPGPYRKSFRFKAVLWKLDEPVAVGTGQEGWNLSACSFQLCEQLQAAAAKFRAVAGFYFGSAGFIHGQSSLLMHVSGPLPEV